MHSMMTSPQENINLAPMFPRYLGAYGANASNFLAYAPGGGVENVGLAQAVNDMLVQSSAGVIFLFPSWPVAERASFVTLRVKGAFLVSSEWDPKQQKAVGTCITATEHSPPTVALSAISLSQAPVTAVEVTCLHGENSRTLRFEGGGLVRWSIAPGERCHVVGTPNNGMED